MCLTAPFYVFFFFNDTATTEIYTLSLHDALPICGSGGMLIDLGFSVRRVLSRMNTPDSTRRTEKPRSIDRKSTRLNSSHQIISYAVFCLKKKKQTIKPLVLTYTPDP